jgi:hypothetical protein
MKIGEEQWSGKQVVLRRGKEEHFSDPVFWTVVLKNISMFFLLSSFSITFRPTWTVKGVLVT